MQAIISGILGWYFNILGHFGLLGVMALMTMESTVFPVPSEMVIPPAAVVGLQHHTSHGVMVLQVLLVILAGTLGSCIGASITYWVSRALGRPLVLKYGKYVFITEKKLQEADRWMLKYGASGIFFARLLPVVRQLIAIPAGIIGMRYSTFSLMTFLGAFLWCSILSLFGLMMRSDMQTIILHHGHFASSAEAQVVTHALHKLVISIIALDGIFMISHRLLTRHHDAPQSEAISVNAEG